jgi:hypothetical protein
MNVLDTPIYKAIAKRVRKQDHNELARMLQLVIDEGIYNEGATSLTCAFSWSESPQGDDYWGELWLRLRR